MTGKASIEGGANRREGTRVERPDGAATSGQGESPSGVPLVGRPVSSMPGIPTSSDLDSPLLPCLDCGRPSKHRLCDHCFQIVKL